MSLGLARGSSRNTGPAQDRTAWTG
jgi:hypothetical protein